MTVSLKPLKELFLSALEIAPKDRAEWLDRECNGGDGLREQLNLMLAAHDSPHSLLDQSAMVEVDATIELASRSAVGSQIGPYKLREQLGEGGMGVVYVAEQTEPVKRKVALKIIKPGMDSQQVVARFEAERQALAMMDHPNIARIIDAGTTDSGRSYFVMELVYGIPITEYCDQHELTTQQRLQIFVKVCRAVQHAHQKGIIHRDLKPSNVLVAAVDGEAVPKVIDFGVAKAAGPKLTEETVYTQFSQIIGTPLYMSPEQAELGVADVDTRSDVYALGVLLYELLTGNTPFDSDTLKAAGFDEMRRIIREDEPPKPSAMVSTLKADALSTISRRRGSDQRKLSESLQGELDWLVMKSLEKDRSRRYESASMLAQDVEWYLNQEPIAAGPPSLTYRFRKYTQRNRGKLIASSLAASILLVAAFAAGGAAMQSRRERREVTQAVAQSLAEARTAMEARDLAVASARISEAKGRITSSRKELKQLAGVVENLGDEISELVITQNDFAQFQELSRDILIGGDVWDGKQEARASEKIREALAIYDVLKSEKWFNQLGERGLTKSQRDEVKQEAYELILNLAENLRSKEEIESAAEALQVLRRAETFHEPTRALYWVRAECQDKIGLVQEAEQTRTKTETAPAKSALDHFLVAYALQESDETHEQAIREYEAALKLQPDHFKSLFWLANRLWRADNLERAAGVYQACSALRPNHYMTLWERGTLAHAMGDDAEAMRLYAECIKLYPGTLNAHRSLAQLHEKQGLYDEALSVWEDFVPVNEAALDVAPFEQSKIYMRRWDFDRAVECIDRTIQVNPRIGYRYFRSKFLRLAGRTQDALAEVNRPIEYHAASKDQVPEHLGYMLAERAVIFAELGQYEQARNDAIRAIENASNAAPVYCVIAGLYASTNHQPIQDFDRALELAELAFGLSKEPSVELGLAQYRVGKFELAASSCKELVEAEHVDQMAYPSAQLVLAMSHYRLGNKESANEAYESATNWLRQRSAEEDLLHLLLETRETLGVEGRSMNGETTSERDKGESPSGSIEGEDSTAQ